MPPHQPRGLAASSGKAAMARVEEGRGIGWLGFDRVAPRERRGNFSGLLAHHVYRQRRHEV
jgi:hypothetical protein